MQRPLPGKRGSLMRRAHDGARARAVAESWVERWVERWRDRDAAYAHLKVASGHPEPEAGALALLARDERWRLRSNDRAEAAQERDGGVALSLFGALAPLYVRVDDRD